MLFVLLRVFSFFELSICVPGSLLNLPRQRVAGPVLCEQGWGAWGFVPVRVSVGFSRASRAGGVFSGTSGSNIKPPWRSPGGAICERTGWSVCFCMSLCGLSSRLEEEPGPL